MLRVLQRHSGRRAVAGARLASDTRLLPHWLPLTAEDRVLDQRGNDRNDVELDLRLLAKGVLAHHRVFYAELEFHGYLADLGGLGDEEPNGDVPLITRGRVVVLGDCRIHPDLPGIRQVEYEKIEHAPLADVRRGLILAARSNFPKVVREDPGR